MLRVSDLVSGLTIAGLGLLVFLRSQTFPAVGGVAIAPSFYPGVIGSILMGLGLALAVRAVLRKEVFPLIRSLDGLRRPGSVVALLAVPLAIVVYGLLSPVIGFIATSFPVSFGVMLAFRVRLQTSVLVAFCLTLAFLSDICKDIARSFAIRIRRGFVDMIFLDALHLVFQPLTLQVIIASALFGLFVGSIPGLTATMATALLVPMTFYMDPVPAIGAIVTCSAMAIFAGDIPGAMVRIPGTPASAAYVNETYRLGQDGQLSKVLSVNLIASAIGGVFGTIALIFLAPQLAMVALNFSTYEYFWLAMIGLSAATLVSTSNPIKGLISLFLGLILATVGLDILTGYPRFTLGTVDLMGGVSLIAALIGLFAVSELFRKALKLHEAPPQPKQVKGPILKHGFGVILRYRLNVLRGSTIGTLLGILPGAGADIAGWISYAVSKQFSKTPGKFGKGHVEGVVDASSSNNASLSGAYVPALVFGIPGDSITAIVVGVLLIKGMTPGPTVFTQSGDIVAAVFVVFILANLLLIPLGLLAIRAARQVLSVNQRILLPLILMFSIVGTFAVNNSVFDLWIALGLGVVGWVMEENDFPIAPMVLGLILGRIVEQNFVNSMIKSGGNLVHFVDRPIAGGLAAVLVAIWIVPIWIRVFRRKRTPSVS